jgi:hypothetical protein
MRIGAAGVPAGADPEGAHKKTAALRYFVELIMPLLYYF